MTILLNIQSVLDCGAGLSDTFQISARAVQYVTRLEY